MRQISPGQRSIAPPSAAPSDSYWLKSSMPVGLSQAGLDAAGQGAKVGYALDFIIGKLDAEMIFQARDQFQRAQAIDLQFLIEVIPRRKLLARDFEVLRRQSQNFFGGFARAFSSSSEFLFYTGPQSPRAIVARQLRQIRMRARIFHEFAKPFHHRGPLEKLAKEIDLAPQLLARNGLREALRRRARCPIEFARLRGGRARYSQSLAFRRHLAHQPRRQRLGGIDAAARKQEVAHDGIANIAPQTRNPAKARNEPQAQLREAKARHLVRDNQVASQRQLESAAKSDSMHRGNRRQRRRIDGIQNPVYAFEKCAHARRAFGGWKNHAFRIELAQIGTGRKSRFLPAVDDQRAGLPFRGLQRGDKLFQVLQHRRADLIARRMMKRQLDRAVLQFPGKRLRFLGKMNLGSGHVGFLQYIDSTASRKWAATASRRNLPFAVSKPLSSVSGRGSM